MVAGVFRFGGSAVSLSRGVFPTTAAELARNVTGSGTRALRRRTLVAVASCRSVTLENE